jgi:hypothetical protein
MTATLAEFEDRIELILQDTGNAIWDTDTIDEALRQAVHAYTMAMPLHM